MGCIETRRTEPEEADSDFRLTLTWDVLKLQRIERYKCALVD